MTGAALGVPAADAIAHGGSCDIAMNPVLDVADELAEEERRADRAAPAIAGVLEIRGVALELVFEILEKRQAPHLLAAAADGGLELLGGRVIRRVPARAGVAEGDDAGAGERRVVDEEIGLERSRVGEGVGEDQTSLGVGVDDLDALAVERRPHVAGAVRVAVGHVLGGGKDAVHLDVRLEARDDLHETDDVRRSAHVVLHLAHARGGLDRDAAGVERDALAHHHDAAAIGAVSRGDVGKVHHTRFMLAALADGLEQAHAALLDLAVVEDLDLEVLFLRHQLRRGGEGFGEKDVRRLVGQIAREVDAGGDDLTEIDASLRVGREIGGEADGHLRELRLRLAIAGHVLGEAIGAHLQAFDDLAEAALEAVRQTEHEALRLVGVGGAGGLRGERADVAGAELGDVAETDQDESIGLHAAERRHRDLLVLLAFELLLFEEAAERSPERAIEAVERRARVLL